MSLPFVRRFGLFLLIASGLLSAIPLEARTRRLATPVVELNEGRLSGQVLKDGTIAFKAVPFAKPPVGDLRWAAPQPPEPWEGVRSGLKSAPACTQADYGWNADLAKTSSEDCLYLELRTPTLDPDARRPVMVFIHGGANRAGGAPGTIMSSLGDNGVVLISIQYRLGALGFMSHPALTAASEIKSPDAGAPSIKASGNYALMDQARALEWVRDNVAKFGGDPNNVTLFGHSAGAQDVGLLMVSPLGRRLFHKAIMQSGNPQFGFHTRSLKQNEEMGVDLTRKVLPDKTIDPASPEGLKALRLASAQAIELAAKDLNAPIDDDGFMWDQVVIDGYVIREAPENTFQAGRQMRIPMIIGLSASEFDLYGGWPGQYKTIEEEYGGRNMKVLRAYGLDVSQDPAHDPLLGSATRQIATDKMFRCPANWLSKLQTETGQLVWFYQLDVFRPSASNKLDLAVHGSELPFVFDAPPKYASTGEWPPLRDYWLAFARTGSPNSLKLDSWVAYGDKARYAEFTRGGLIMKADIRKDICEYRLSKD